jgi:hypothetical protein
MPVPNGRGGRGGMRQWIVAIIGTGKDQLEAAQAGRAMDSACSAVSS